MPGLYKQVLAKGHVTRQCKMDSGLSLHTGQRMFTCTILARSRSLVGKHSEHALQRKLLIFGGIFRFHKRLQNPELPLVL